ncbi:MAG: GntR family transcriptional regulator [Oscillospiraceae bacterium]|mgnify:FL=1
MAGFDGTRPIFLQLAEMLEEGIISGAYPEEGQIPSITEFSATLKINPATALKGINLLVDEGLVYKKRGVGMFVATGARDALLKKRQESFYTDRVRPVAREASSLGLTLPELTRLVERAYNDEEKE